MIRYVACVAVILFAGATLRAGELDKEFGAKAPVAPMKHRTMTGGVASVAVLAPAGMAVGRTGSELDEEMPAQSWRRGWCGWAPGWGCGGWGPGWAWSPGWGVAWRGRAWGGCGWGPGWGWGGGFVSTPWASVRWGYPVWDGGW